MKNIGTIDGFSIYWSDPQGDGGRGTGEVMVGSDSAGSAQSQDEAMKVAKRFIDSYQR